MNELSHIEAAKLLIAHYDNDRDLPSMIFWNDNYQQLSARTLCAVDFDAAEDSDRYPFWTTDGEFFKHCAYVPNS
jgi:hypothetical protein